MPNEPISTEAFQGVRDLIHDLRNSLYVWRIGLEMLPEVRGDAEKFLKIVGQLAAEERRAAQRLEEFAQTPRQPESGP